MMRRKDCWALRTTALLMVVLLLTVAGAGPLRGQNPPPSTGEAKKPSPPAEVQLSFSGADINAIVKWLAEMTGKSIIKHKDVKCKVNVLSSKKISRDDAIRLVYRALALEGFSAIESKSIIIIVPEKMEGKVSPELFNGDEPFAGGKSQVIKIIALTHAKAGNLKEKLKAVLSEKAKLEVDERANKVIVTDYAENVKFLEQLIKELDIPAASEVTVRVFPLVHTEADGLAKLITSIFSGGKPGAPPQPGTAIEGVMVLADNDSNRLIATGPLDKMPDVVELIQTLDTARPADVAVRTIPLTHVKASELVSELRPMYRKLSGASLKETIEVTANSLSNSVIVLSSQANFESIQTLIDTLDTKDAEQKAMRIFKLQFADAEDVATQLEELHARNRPSSNTYFYSSRSRDTRGEVRFVAMRRTNEVMAIGPPGALDRIEGTVKLLDQPAGDEALAPRIYPLQFVSAEDIATVLDDLFVKKEERNYWYYDEPQDDRDVGRLFGKVRIAAEPSSNSLIVTTNSVENFSAFEKILEQLDVRNEANEATLNVPLRFAKPVSVANNLNILFARRGAPNRRPQNQQNQPRNNNQNNQNQNLIDNQSFELEDEKEEEPFFPWLGGGGNQGRPGTRGARPVSDLVGKVRIVPDSRTNSLLVTTSPHYFPQVLSLVQDLDIPTAQVLVEASIIEISRDDVERLGTRWSPDGGSIWSDEDLDNSVIGSGMIDYTETFVGSALGDSKRRGTLSGMVNLDLLIQFLVKNTDTRVRAEPRLNVADNERGKLFVGARVPFITESTFTSNDAQNQSFSYVDVGIIVEVTPHVNINGEVTLRIRVEASKVREGVTLFGGAILDTRSFRSELTVTSGTTIVLGGIIQRNEDQIIRKLPILGDIPLLGYFFKKKDVEVRDVELMVFLTPEVTRTPQEVEELMEKERIRTRQIRQWQEELDLERAAAAEEK